MNLDLIISKIEKARLQISEHHIVQIVAISKYSTSDDIVKLYNKGQRAFGENKIQDLKAKSKTLENLPISWHFVGSLQKNKINNLIDLNPVLMHSLDSFILAQELNKKLQIKNKTINCLLQINSSFEDTKSGINPKDAINLYDKISKNCKNINLKGVMSIGANSKDKEKIKKSFDLTFDIFKSCKGATICSMGMSGDFQLAIGCGANMVRIGSAIFDKN
jgi:pyridoxal phosphate enzyme (YggS family)